MATPVLAVLVALAGLLAAPGAAQAATVDRYELTDVRFEDGGTATGWFESIDGDRVGDFEITVEGGNGSAFPPVTYSSANGSSGIVGFPEAPGKGFIVYPAPTDGNAGRRLALFGTEATGSDGERLVTLDSGNSYECFNCTPFRSASGSMTITTTTSVIAPEIVLGPQGGCGPDSAGLLGRVSDEDSSLGDVTVTATSTDPAVATGEISRSPADADTFFVVVTPHRAGEAFITINASDGLGQTGTTLRVAIGNARDNSIASSSATDVVFGLDGDDTMAGGSGFDVLCGGVGDDRLDGGGSTDVLVGGTGADLLLGRDGGDYLDGETGRDDLRGSGGDDGLFGRGGNDRLTGGSGHDYFDGGAGRDDLVDVGPRDTTA